MTWGGRVGVLTGKGHYSEVFKLGKFVKTSFVPVSLYLLENYLRRVVSSKGRRGQGLATQEG